MPEKQSINSTPWTNMKNLVDDVADLDTEGVKKFRSKYRPLIPESYSGRRHLALIVATTTAAIIGCVWWLGGLSWEVGAQTGFAPFTISFQFSFWAMFAFSNWVEYKLHHAILHRPGEPTRHSGVHHRYFTHRLMDLDNFDKDANVIMFHPFFLVILYSIVLPPIGLITSLIFGQRVGAYLVFTGSLYYLSYELLHLAYHLPPSSWVGRLPFMERLKQHHLTHHNLGLMRDYNQNITFPIWDWLYGTTWKSS